MSGLLNTSEPEKGLIRSLRIQPLLVVLRPDPADLEDVFPTTRLCRQLDQLVEAGVQHVEIAWCDHPRWADLVIAAMSGLKGVSVSSVHFCRNAAVAAVP